MQRLEVDVMKPLQDGRDRVEWTLILEDIPASNGGFLVYVTDI